MLPICHATFTVRSLWGADSQLDTCNPIKTSKAIPVVKVVIIVLFIIAKKMETSE